MERFEVLGTRPDFEVVEFHRVFDSAVMERIRRVVLTLQPSLLERHEREDSVGLSSTIIRNSTSSRRRSSTS